MAVAAGEMQSPQAALARLRATAASDPTRPQIWRVLADHLDETGDRAGAASAYLRHVQHAIHDPALMAAGAALHANRIPEAETRLRNQLKQAPTDVVAIRMFAELAMRLDRGEDAEHLLERCLELAPDFQQARHNYAIVLHRNNKPALALAELETLLRLDPKEPASRNLKAAVLCRVGEYESAIEIYDGLLREFPQQAHVWLSFGHALKTAGHNDRAIAAYTKCTELEPTFGEAYWSLANLKTFRFSDAQIQSMRDALARDLDDEHRLHLDFALGKALEDRRDYETSFNHYAAGNALRLKRRARARALHGGFLSRTRRRRLQNDGADLHRGFAALGIDADRANPRQSRASRRHHGIAGDHVDDARVETRQRRQVLSRCARAHGRE
jgi:predicted Zn-dependent protease